MRKQLFLVTALGLSACSGGGGGSSAPAALPPAPTSQVALDADESAAQIAAVSDGSKAALSNTNWAGVPKPVRPFALSGTLEDAERAITPLSYHGPDVGGYVGAGQAGLNLTPTTQYKALYASHDVYHPSTQLELPTPPSNYSNWLYAPTTKGAQGSCLEIGSWYVRGNPPSVTTGGVYVYDFCGGPGATFSLDPSSNFWTKYVSASRHRPSYYQIANVQTSPTTWAAEFFNVQSQKWDIAYAANGNFQGWGGNGWSMYEQHYQAPDSASVLCPSGLPGIGARNLSMRTRNGQTTYFSPTNSSPYIPLSGETSFGAYGACFNNTMDSNGVVSVASSSFDLTAANYWWNVINSR